VTGTVVDTVTCGVVVLGWVTAVVVTVGIVTLGIVVTVGIVTFGLVTSVVFVIDLAVGAVTFGIVVVVLLLLVDSDLFLVNFLDTGDLIPSFHLTDLDGFFTGIRVNGFVSNDGCSNTGGGFSGSFPLFTGGGSGGAVGIVLVTV